MGYRYKYVLTSSLSDDQVKQAITELTEVHGMCESYGVYAAHDAAFFLELCSTDGVVISKSSPRVVSEILVTVSKTLGRPVSLEYIGEGHCNRVLEKVLPDLSDVGVVCATGDKVEHFVLEASLCIR